MIITKLNIMADTSLIILKLMAMRLIVMRLKTIKLKRMVKKRLSSKNCLSLKRQNQAFLYLELG